MRTGCPQKIALGDYGRLQNGVFHRDGKLEDLKIEVKRGAPDEARALYQYHSKNSSALPSSRSMLPANRPRRKPRPGWEIKFVDANSVFFNAAGCALSTVTNVSAIRDAVRRKLKDDKWEYDWVVITTLIEAKSTTAIISSSRNGAIGAERRNQRAAHRSGRRGAEAWVSSESNIGLKLVTEPGCAPLFACHQAHWKLLGKPGWQTKLLRAEAEQSETAAQIQALRASGEMDIEEFDFVEIGKR